MDQAAAAGARVRFAGLVARAMPKAGAAAVDSVVDGLVAWRASMLEAGALLHGIVAFPADAGAGDGVGAVWHVLGGVIALPSAPAELDLGEALARAIDSRFGGPEACYTESFDTEMGLGAGLITSTFIPAGGAASRIEGSAPRGGTPGLALGLAAAIACPPGGGVGLLVVGVCLDSDQAGSLAALVAAIAGNSRIRRPYPGRTETVDPIGEESAHE